MIDGFVAFIVTVINRGPCSLIKYTSLNPPTRQSTTNLFFLVKKHPTSRYLHIILIWQCQSSSHPSLPPSAHLSLPPSLPLSPPSFHLSIFFSLPPFSLALHLSPPPLSSSHHPSFPPSFHFSFSHPPFLPNSPSLSRHQRSRLETLAHYYNLAGSPWHLRTHWNS